MDNRTKQVQVRLTPEVHRKLKSFTSFRGQKIS